MRSKHDSVFVCFVGVWLSLYYSVILCLFRSLWFCVVGFAGFCFFQYRAKRLAGKNISEMTYSVSSGTLNLALSLHCWLSQTLRASTYWLITGCGWIICLQKTDRAETNWENNSCLVLPFFAATRGMEELSIVMCDDRWACLCHWTLTTFRQKHGRIKTKLGLMLQQWRRVD